MSGPDPNEAAMVTLHRVRGKLADMAENADKRRDPEGDMRPCMEERHRQYWRGRRAAILEIMVFMGMNTK